MSLYGRLFRRALFPVWEGMIRGRPTLERLRYLEQTQWRSPEEIAALQMGDLRRLLSHAFDHVPLYRERMERVGMRPLDVRALEDLARLPILTREEARETSEARTATAGATLAVKKSTSGTTGRPLVFGYDAPSEYWRQAVKLRGYG